MKPLTTNSQESSSFTCQSLSLMGASPVARPYSARAMNVVESGSLILPLKELLLPCLRHKAIPRKFDAIVSCFHAIPDVVSFGAQLQDSRVVLPYAERTNIQQLYFSPIRLNDQPEHPVRLRELYVLFRDMCSNASVPPRLLCVRL